MKLHGLVIAIVVLAGHCSLSAAEVRLRSAVGCGTAVVRVGDVAEVFADDVRIGNALAEITLCPAPSPGITLSLTQTKVAELLALSGVDRKTANVTGSETVTVTAEAASRSGAASAKRPMVASGIRQAAFDLETEPTRKSPVTQAAKAQIGTQRDDKDSRSPPIIEKGSIVTVNARAAGVKITTSGKALDDGATGETIGIELADGKQRILARVSGPQMVEVSN